MKNKALLLAFANLCVGVCFGEVNINVNINVNEDGEPKPEPEPHPIGGPLGGGGIGGILGGILGGIIGGGVSGGLLGGGGSGGPPLGGGGPGGPPWGGSGSGESPSDGGGSGGCPPWICGGSGGGPPSGGGGSGGGSAGGAPSGGGGSGGGPPWGGSGGSGGGPPPGVLEGLASDGPCPDPPVEQNFNLTRYLGRWYEIERMYNPFQYGGCVTADYSLRQNGTVKVVNSNGLINTTRDTLEGTAIPSNGTEGRLTVSFPMSGGYQTPTDGGANYNILKTDYDSYAIVYTCATFKIYTVETKIEFGWILSRTPKVPGGVIDYLKTYLDNVNVDSQRFNATNQENCPRLPINY